MLLAGKWCRENCNSNRAAAVGFRVMSEFIRIYLKILQFSNHLLRLVQ